MPGTHKGGGSGWLKGAGVGANNPRLRANRSTDQGCELTASLKSLRASSCSWDGREKFRIPLPQPPSCAKPLGAVEPSQPLQPHHSTRRPDSLADMHDLPEGGAWRRFSHCSLQNEMCDGAALQRRGVPRPRPHAHAHRDSVRHHDLNE